MGTYQGNKQYNATIYIIEPLDPIQAGDEGIDSKPNVDIQDNFSHLKKFKGTLIQGNGSPSGTEGFDR